MLFTAIIGAVLYSIHLVDRWHRPIEMGRVYAGLVTFTACVGGLMLLSLGLAMHHDTHSAGSYSGRRPTADYAVTLGVFGVRPCEAFSTRKRDVLSQEPQSIAVTNPTPVRRSMSKIAFVMANAVSAFPRNTITAIHQATQWHLNGRLPFRVAISFQPVIMGSTQAPRLRSLAAPINRTYTLGVSHHRTLSRSVLVRAGMVLQHLSGPFILLTIYLFNKRLMRY